MGPSDFVKRTTAHERMFAMLIYMIDTSAYYSGIDAIPRPQLIANTARIMLGNRSYSTCETLTNEELYQWAQQFASDNPGFLDECLVHFAEQISQFYDPEGRIRPPAGFREESDAPWKPEHLLYLSRRFRLFINIGPLYSREERLAWFRNRQAAEQRASTAA